MGDNPNTKDLDDTVHLAMAIGNHNETAAKRIAEDVWNRHKDDPDQGVGAWKNVMAGANRIDHDAAQQSPDQVSFGTVNYDGSITFGPAPKLEPQTNEAGNTELGDKVAGKSALAPVIEALKEVNK